MKRFTINKVKPNTTYSLGFYDFVRTLEIRIMKPKNKKKWTIEIITSKII